MSHYHMVGAMVSAYHSDDAACGGGSHTRYDTGEQHYWSEMAKLAALVRIARRPPVHRRSAFRHRKRGRA